MQSLPEEVRGQCCFPAWGRGEIQTHRLARGACPRRTAELGCVRGERTECAQREQSVPDSPAPSCPQTRHSLSQSHFPPPEYASSGEPSPAAGLSFQVQGNEKGAPGRAPMGMWPLTCALK